MREVKSVSTASFNRSLSFISAFFFCFTQSFKETCLHKSDSLYSNLRLYLVISLKYDALEQFVLNLFAVGCVVLAIFPCRKQPLVRPQRYKPNLIMANLWLRPCWRWEATTEQSTPWKEAVQPLGAVRIPALPGKMQMSSDTRQVCD